MSFYTKDIDTLSDEIQQERNPLKQNIIDNGGDPDYLKENNLPLSETPANWLGKPTPKWRAFGVSTQEPEPEEKDEEALIEEFTSGTMNRGFNTLWNYEENGTYPFRDATNILYDSGIFFPKANGQPIFDPNALEVEKSRWGLENVALFSFNMTKGAVDLARFRELDDLTQLAYFQALDLYNTKLPMLYYDNEEGNFDGVAWDGIFRAVHGIASDPATYLSLGIYNQLPKLTAQLGGKSITTQILKGMLSSTALTAYEGGTWAGVANYQAQQVEIEGAGLNPIVQDKIEQAGEENPYKTELDKGELGFNIGIGFIAGPALEQAVPLTKLAYNKLNEIYTNIKKPSGDSGGGSVDVNNPDGLTDKQILVKEMEEIDARILKFEEDNNMALWDNLKDASDMKQADSIESLNEKYYQLKDNKDFEIADEYYNLINEKFLKQNEIEKAPLTLYHGSPHEFDEFDISKIGSGEGHQAYGHGLYFAEEEEVSQIYKGFLGKRVEIDGVETIKDGRRTDLSDSVDSDNIYKVRKWSDMIKHYDPEEMPELSLSDVVEDSFEQKNKSIENRISIKRDDLVRNEHFLSIKDRDINIRKDIIQRTIDHLNEKGEDAFDFLESLTIDRGDGTILYNRVPDYLKYGDLSEEEFFKKYDITQKGSVKWLALTFKEALEGMGDTIAIPKYIGDDADGKAIYDVSYYPEDQKSQSVSDSLRMFQDNPDLLKKRHEEVVQNNYDSYVDDDYDIMNKINDLKDEKRELENLTSELMNLIKDDKVKIENTGKMYETEVDIKPEQTIDYDDFVSDRNLKESLHQTMLDLFDKNDGFSANDLVDALEDEIKKAKIPGIFDDNINEVMFDYNSVPDKGFYNTFENFLYEIVFDNLTGEQILRAMRDALNISSFGDESAESAVELLRKALVNNDIKGLKFDDQLSRGSNKDVGTHNYVIYDDRIINIVKRYGVPVPIAGYMLSQLDGQNNNQDQIN